MKGRLAVPRPGQAFKNQFTFGLLVGTGGGQQARPDSTPLYLRKCQLALQLPGCHKQPCTAFSD